jgi:hypothetical protein
MTKLIKTARLAGVLVALLASMALDLRAAQPENAVREGQDVVTELGANASPTTYWFAESDVWHVVTTIDIVVRMEGAEERHAVARFSAVLLPGQVQLISVPYPPGEQQQVVRVRRTGDWIEIARLPGSSV